MTDRDNAIFRSLFDRILRADDYPGAWALIGQHVAGEIEGDPTLSPGLSRLDAEAAAVFGAGFPELHPLQQDELLDRIELDQVRTRWENPGSAEWLSRTVNLIGQAHHAGDSDEAVGG